jgi:hypothetical protein
MKESDKNFDEYTTHKKYTELELNKLKSRSHVLELGIGNGSSPLMYEFCKNNPTSKVMAFETNNIWFEKIFDLYGDLPNYVFYLIDNWDDLPNNLNKNKRKYDLVFVDQSPWQARINSIDFLKDKVKTFILHDYDYYNKLESGFPTEKCNDIYVNDETSWLGKKYSDEFILEDNYDILPPTLIMRKK